jgi:putative DNA primase/helicase
MSVVIDIPVDDPLKAAWLDTSDFGNGKRVVIVAAGRLKWIEEMKAWAWYDGQRWSIERGDMEAQRIAHRVIEHIDIECEALSEIAENAPMLKKKVGSWCTAEIAQERIKTLRGHAVRSGSAGMTGGMLKQARSFLSARLADFDTCPYRYNVQNGTLRFVRREAGWQVQFTPHDPADMLMQIANVDYEPAASAPFWQKRIEMLTPDPEQRAAFRPLYGYTLLGLVSDQSFYVHQGKGGDGKSMTHIALFNMHGDYARHAGINTFLQGREGGGAEHRSDLVRLRGDVRFVLSDEPPKTATWDGKTIKQITGSLVTARGANEKTEITFAPRFKLFVECNIIPRAPSDDKGFRRRFKLFQWTVSLDSLEDGVMPADLVQDKLSDERSGILNWLIGGALEWLETRVIPQPSAMADVLSDFWADSSPLIEWMSEWCDTSDPNALAPFSDLYEHFKQWCTERDADAKTMSKTSFGRQLRDKQHTNHKDARGNRFRKGIQLRAQGLFGAPAAPGKIAEPLPAVTDAWPQPADDDDDGYGSDWT